MATRTGPGGQVGPRHSFFNVTRKVKYSSQESSDSSSDESVIPTMVKLRSDAVQVKVNKGVGELEHAASSPGKQN